MDHPSSPPVMLSTNRRNISAPDPGNDATHIGLIGSFLVGCVQVIFWHLSLSAPISNAAWISITFRVGDCFEMKTLYKISYCTRHKTRMVIHITSDRRRQWVGGVAIHFSIHRKYSNEYRSTTTTDVPFTTCCDGTERRRSNDIITISLHRNEQDGSRLIGHFCTKECMDRSVVTMTLSGLDTALKISRRCQESGYK
jgi:hypothetical protein